MDFSAVALTEAQQAFAQEVRAFLDEHLTPEVVAGMRERRVVGTRDGGLAATEIGDAVHRLLELTDRGCPAEFAAPIRAPLER